MPKAATSDSPLAQDLSDEEIDRCIELCETDPDNADCAEGAQCADYADGGGTELFVMHS